MSETAKPTAAVRPTVCRVVEYVLDAGPNRGARRPAMIVRVWEGSETPANHGLPLVNLQAFTDGPNDDLRTEITGFAQNTEHRTSVHYDPEGQTPGTWRWPPRA